MIVLTVTILLAIYFGIVASVIFRLNQSRVLDGRVKTALVLPIWHFIVIPFVIIFLDKSFLDKRKNIFFRLYFAWQWIFIFPIILSTFAAVLALDIKSSAKEDDKDEGIMDRKTYQSIYQEKVAFA